MIIRRCRAEDAEIWATLRHELWPDANHVELCAEADDMLADNADQLALIACDADGDVFGFAEATIRRDYVNGCETSPVGFLEGIYVREARRRQGVARALCDHVEQWVRAQGCTEFASDALLDNTDSHAMHEALGFTETERVVYFRKTVA